MDIEVAEHWFELYGKVMEEYRVLQGNTYNMDEKGCILGLISKAKVLISKKTRSKFIQEPGNRESATVLECISGDGTVIPPLIIWLASTHRNNWYPLLTPATFNFAISPNGYTDHELRYLWLIQVF